MKKIKRAAVRASAAALALLLCILFAPAARAASDPNVQSTASLLMERTTGMELYSHNADAKAAPASLTKIMTATLAVEAYERGEIGLNDVVTVPADAYYDVTADGSTLNLKEGEQLTFRELLYGILLASSNEACNVMAERIAGSPAAFIELMNARAKELGCTGTHFANAHGLPNDDHYTTARDLYLIASNALKHSLFCEVVGTSEHTIPATNMSAARKLENTNKLLQKGGANYYEYAYGVKTGYTAAAGYCLVSAAKKDSLNLICVVLGAESKVIEDGTTQVQSFSESKRLLQWGFSSFSYRTILSTLDLVTEVPVAMGAGADAVVARPKSNIVALMDNDEDLSKIKPDVHIYTQEAGKTLDAPISSGQTLGSVGVTLGDTDYGSVDLVANSDISLDRAAFVKRQISETLSNKYVRLGIALLLLFFVSYIVFIIAYNARRKRRRAMEDAIARRRIQELRSSEEPTTGKSFEEIERMHSRRR